LISLFIICFQPPDGLLTYVIITGVTKVSASHHVDQQQSNLK